MACSTNLDPLTGLPQRVAFIDAITGLLGVDGQSPCALILFDIDRFKSVNDGLGPDLGDALLSRIAKRLVELTKNATMLARVSGDGFGVLLAHPADALRIAENMLEFVCRPYAVLGHAIEIGGSVGIAWAPQDGSDASTLFHSADLALHEAEHDGRRGLRQFEPPMKARALRRRVLEEDLRVAVTMQHVELRRALVSRQFEVHYQPKLSLAGRRLTGFEALLRWRHPVRGWISPAEFIPVAEEIGLIEFIGEWVLRVACRDAAQWPVPQDGVPLGIAVNLSPMQLRNMPAVLQSIRIAVEESNLDVERLELEITESALVNDFSDVLHEIKRLGCKLAIDDFGTEYSSLARLRDLPFDCIKIDRSFIRGVGEQNSEPDRKRALWMLHTIGLLGHGLGLTTVAEGVETDEQAELALGAGCVEMQGFLISPAMPADKVADFIAKMQHAEP